MFPLICFDVKKKKILFFSLSIMYGFLVKIIHFDGGLRPGLHMYQND
jgi:hypothetical protein